MTRTGAFQHNPLREPLLCIFSEGFLVLTKAACDGEGFVL